MSSTSPTGPTGPKITVPSPGQQSPGGTGASTPIVLSSDDSVRLANEEAAKKKKEEDEEAALNPVKEDDWPTSPNMPSPKDFKAEYLDVSWANLWKMLFRAIGSVGNVVAAGVDAASSKEIQGPRLFFEEAAHGADCHGLKKIFNKNKEQLTKVQTAMKEKISERDKIKEDTASLGEEIKSLKAAIAELPDGDPKKSELQRQLKEKEKEKAQKEAEILLKNNALKPLKSQETDLLNDLKKIKSAIELPGGSSSNRAQFRKMRNEIYDRERAIKADKHLKDLRDKDKQETPDMASEIARDQKVNQEKQAALMREKENLDAKQKMLLRGEAGKLPGYQDKIAEFDSNERRIEDTKNAIKILDRKTSQLQKELENNNKASQQLSAQKAAPGLAPEKTKALDQQLEKMQEKNRQDQQNLQKMQEQRKEKEFDLEKLFEPMRTGMIQTHALGQAPTIPKEPEQSMKETPLQQKRTEEQQRRTEATQKETRKTSPEQQQPRAVAELSPTRPQTTPSSQIPRGAPSPSPRPEPSATGKTQEAEKRTHIQLSEAERKRIVEQQQKEQERQPTRTRQPQTSSAGPQTPTSLQKQPSQPAVTTAAKTGPSPTTAPGTTSPQASSASTKTAPTPSSASSPQQASPGSTPSGSQPKGPSASSESPKPGGPGSSGPQGAAPKQPEGGMSQPKPTPSSSSTPGTEPKQSSPVPSSRERSQSEPTPSSGKGGAGADKEKEADKKEDQSKKKRSASVVVKFIPGGQVLSKGLEASAKKDSADAAKLREEAKKEKEQEQKKQAEKSKAKTGDQASQFSSASSGYSDRQQSGSSMSAANEGSFITPQKDAKDEERGSLKDEVGPAPTPEPTPEPEAAANRPSPGGP